MNDQAKISVAQIRIASAFRGTEQYVSEVCRGLKTRGHLPMIITLPSGPLAVSAREMDIPFAELEIRGDMNVLTPYRVSRALRKLGAELVNTHGSHGSCLCSLGARMAGIPAIHTVHGPDNKYAGLPAIHLIAISEYVKKHLMKQGVPAKRISVVRSGVDTEQFTPRDQSEARAELGLEPEPFYFATIAMFQKHKGLPFLLDAFRGVVGKAPHTRLLLAGSGILEDELRAQVERLELGSFVHFLGFRSDVRPVLAASDCLVLPSEVEGLGLVLLEAMACGRPTIATDAGGPNEVVCEGETGRIVQCNATDELLKAMMYAIDNPQWTREAGLAARSRVKEERSLDRQVDETLGVYYKVLGR